MNPGGQLGLHNGKPFLHVSIFEKKNLKEFSSPEPSKNFTSAMSFKW
jgi:hypothetical protein